MFQIGDVVQLKSGGPKMTIAAVKSDRAICVWFNKRDAYHEEKTAEFLVPTLTLLSGREKAPEPAVQSPEAMDVMEDSGG